MPTKENGPKKRRNNRKVVLLIILIMAAAVAAAIIVGRTVLPSGTTDSTVSVSLPLIVTPLTDPATGREYNVQTLFAVQLNRDLRRNTTDEQLTEEMTSIMKTMDMAKLLEPGRLEYLNERATELLRAQLDGENVDTRVLVVDFATDDRVTLTDPEERSSQVMEGLFQNMD